MHYQQMFGGKFIRQSDINRQVKIQRSHLINLEQCSLLQKFSHVHFIISELLVVATHL